MVRFVIKSGDDYYAGGSYIDYDGNRHPNVTTFPKAKRFLFESVANKIANTINEYENPKQPFSAIKVEE